jgi:hypothetical protein
LAHDVATRQKRKRILKSLMAKPKIEVSEKILKISFKKMVIPKVVQEIVSLLYNIVQRKASSVCVPTFDKVTKRNCIDL